ncbi:hypothetical protein [Methanosarcina horonobensis]|nr:hypothetical protein [Methanosarcina horonobensis]
MLASASIILIYTAVNVSHLRLLKETGAKPYIVWAALLSSLVIFGILIYYEYMNSKTTLSLLGFTVFLCFAAEWTYRK